MSESKRMKHDDEAIVVEKEEGKEEALNTTTTTIKNVDVMKIFNNEYLKIKKDYNKNLMKFLTVEEAQEILRNAIKTLLPNHDEYIEFHIKNLDAQAIDLSFEPEELKAYTYAQEAAEMNKFKDLDFDILNELIQSDHVQRSFKDDLHLYLNLFFRHWNYTYHHYLVNTGDYLKDGNVSLINWSLMYRMKSELCEFLHNFMNDDDYNINDCNNRDLVEDVFKQYFNEQQHFNEQFEDSIKITFTRLLRLTLASLKDSYISDDENTS